MKILLGLTLCLIFQGIFSESSFALDRASSLDIARLIFIIGKALENILYAPNAQNIDIRLELIQEVLARRSTEHWIDRLNKERVPCSPVITRQEMLDNEQVQVNSIILEYAHEKAGPIRQARAAAQFSLTPTPNPVGAPGLGQHSKEILLEAGLQERDILSLVSDGVVEA